MGKYLEASTTLNGKYQINSVLGENPLAITYGGVDTATNSKIVIREFFPSGMCSRAQDNMQVTASGDFEKEKTQFVQESQVLKKNTNLEGIAATYDVFEENGTVYSIVEFVDGISLEKYLTNSGKQFPIKRIKELMEPIIASMSKLHNAGIVHRNISPDNLIFTNQGKLKLIGFGCLQGHISDESVGYAPVELYRRQQEIKPAADIYAICASIYRCITGIRPQDAYGRINDDQVKKPSELGVAIELNEENIIMMGMNIYEEKRFRTVNAIKNALYREAAKPSEPIADDRTLCVQPLNEKTEIVQTPVNNVPPVIPNDIVAPTNTNDASKKKESKKENKKENKKEKAPEKEKSGSIGWIAAIVGGVAVIAALCAAVFIMGKDLIFDSDNKLANKTEETDIGEEASDEQQTKEEKTQIVDEYKTMLEAGDYTGIIDRILASDISTINASDKDALSEILSQAVNNQYVSFEGRVSSCQSVGDYDGAFAAVNEQAALYDKYEANEMLAQYVNRQQLDDKRAGIKNAHITYLFGERLDSVVSQGDENAIEEIIAKAQEYVNEGIITNEELDKKKASAYARFCIEKVTVMNSSGTDAASIQAYIKDNLGKTGNSCQMLEFWDYFNSVRGLNATDDTIKHALADGHFLAGSDTVNLTTNDISHLTRYELRLAMYEIFARHGKIFSDSAVNRYFGRFTWYQPNESFDESTLTEVEEYNLNLLVNYQQTMGYAYGY